MTGRVHTFGDADRRTVVSENPDEVEEPVLAFFLGYWRSKLRGRLPAPGDFIPKEVRTNLRWVITVDVLRELGDFRYRVVGSAVCEYFLGDGTGKTVSEAFAAHEIRDGVLWLYRLACEVRRPIRCTGPASMSGDTFFPAYDSLYLPYARDGYVVDRLVTAFVFNPKTIETQRPAPSRAVAR